MRSSYSLVNTRNLQRRVRSSYVVSVSVAVVDAVIFSVGAVKVVVVVVVVYWVTAATLILR